MSLADIASVVVNYPINWRWVGVVVWAGTMGPLLLLAIGWMTGLIKGHD